MNSIIQFNEIYNGNAVDQTSSSGVNHIDIQALKSKRKLNAGLIAPAQEKVVDELADEHKAEPIKSLDEIMMISEYFISKERYRDNMLFIVGINFGLRVSDLRLLRFCSIINDDLTFKDKFPVLEKKTKNTRKVKKNRWITINDAVIDAVTLYLEHTDGVSLSDYMFKSESNHGSNINTPIHRNSIDRILKEAVDALGIQTKVSTHTLRKTFGFHQMMMCNNDPRKLLVLSKMFGHSSTAVTLEYIGITGDEIADAYRNLNLGSKGKSYLDSGIMETEQLVG